ncbi:MAG TPA: amidohydrolase family protein [Chloroflexota bacterium]|nr:amidohydrolase family protein [Chloroflexota bacterium]
MPVIDADTHVDETEATWDFMAPEDQVFKPTTGYPENQDPSRPPSRYWLIDGKRQIRFIRSDAATRTTVEARELLDVDARLRAMDELGIDVQVMYPTLMLVEFTDRPELERALRRSYNRWLADRAERSRGRLRWVCLPPTQSMDEALAELRFAKDHGAVGVMKKGDREAGKWPCDPYFFPLYEEAERLNLPICFHTGSGVPDFTPARQFSYSSFYRITLPVVHAFQSMILHEVPAKFPTLRFGFIEASASWVPFVLYDLRRRQVRAATRAASPISGPSVEITDDVLKANRLYVACQVDEDLPYILKHTGEDNVLVGSDFTHSDQAMELDFHAILQRRADAGEISHEAVRKITYDNPRAFYGL